MVIYVNVNVTYRRKASLGMLMLIYFSSLFCDVFFLHSHWSEGNLVAIHSHPYSFDKEEEGNRKKRNNHSKQEYELYDLIYSTPLLALEFFDFQFTPVSQEVDVFSVNTLRSYTSSPLALRQVRGPPFFV